MRKRVRVLILAAIVAAVVVPVGFALSLESHQVAPTISGRASIIASTVVSTPSLIDSGTASIGTGWSPSDPVKLLLVGTIFLAVAAAVRRTI